MLSTLFPFALLPRFTRGVQVAELLGLGDVTSPAAVRPSRLAANAAVHAYTQAPRAGGSDNAGVRKALLSTTAANPVLPLPQDSLIPPYSQPFMLTLHMNSHFYKSAETLKAWM